MKKIYKILLFLLSIHNIIHTQKYDLTVIGSCNFFSSISLQAVSALYRHCNTLKVNFMNINSGNNFADVPLEVQNVIKNEDSSSIGKIAYYTGCLSMPYRPNMYKKVPNSPIKIALSMVESTKIPRNWSSIINENFDAVVVPDPWLEPVYKSCGVKKPIFVIPLSCFLDSFLQKPPKMQKNGRIFKFGISCNILDTKNVYKLAKAFLKEFKPYESVEFHVIGGYGTKLKKRFERLANGNKKRRIVFYKNKFNYENYVQFIRSLDCYTLISKGEGFSITPREALAAGIPCILANNTAQKTICDTGFVRAVPSNIIIPSKGELFGIGNVGNNFDCKIEDVQSALRDVYNHYHHYLKLAHKGREWVKQFTHENLEKKYHSLFKPTTILLGEHNKVTDNYFMTNSKELYTKYKSIFEAQ